MRKLRRVAGLRRWQPTSTKRSITEAERQISGSSGGPTPAEKAPSRLAAKRQRPGPCDCRRGCGAHGGARKARHGFVHRAWTKAGDHSLDDADRPSLHSNYPVAEVAARRWMLCEAVGDGADRPQVAALEQIRSELASLGFSCREASSCARGAAGRPPVRVARIPRACTGRFGSGPGGTKDGDGDAPLARGAVRRLPGAVRQPPALKGARSRTQGTQRLALVDGDPRWAG